MRFIPLLLLIGLFPINSAALSTSAGPWSLEVVAEDLDQPWGMAFLPDGGFLVTERDGRMWHYTDGGRVDLAGVPRVEASGQGGLLDVMVPRDFVDTREVYFTFAKRQGRGSGTAVGKAILAQDGRSLRNTETIFEIARGSSGGRHFGSRLVEAPDGTLFVTVGDRGDRPSAQDLGSHNGSVLRITKSGAPAPGNPFIGQEGLDEIWSYGHRNAQGAALDLNGNLWTVEHGAKGGDEVNKVDMGANYGWPVISYGVHYSGRKIGVGTEQDGLEQPVHFWDPSIAPSGMMIYSGKLWPEWAGDIFVGSLKFGLISRLENGREVERIEGDETARVRDVREAPDGSIWFMSVGNGEIYRATPQ